MPGNPSRQLHSQPANAQAQSQPPRRHAETDTAPGLSRESLSFAPRLRGRGMPRSSKVTRRNLVKELGVCRTGIPVRNGAAQARSGRGGACDHSGPFGRRSGAPLPGPPVRLRPRARGRSGNSRADPETAERTRKRRAPSPVSAGTRRFRGGDGGGCCAGGRGRGGPATAAGGWYVRARPGQEGAVGLGAGPGAAAGGGRGGGVVVAAAVAVGDRGRGVATPGEGRGLWTLRADGAWRGLSWGGAQGRKGRSNEEGRGQA